MGKIAQEQTLNSILEYLRLRDLRPDWYYDVAIGDIDGAIDYAGFGLNEDIDAATTPEDIWINGGLFTAPTTYRVHNIVSTDANDTSAGTGARTVKVYGVTEMGLKNETIVMNGLANVSTTYSYSDIYIIHVLTAGSGLTNAGTITATAVTDGTITASIAVNGLNTTRKAIRLIPPGYTGYLFDWHASMQQNTANSFASVYLLTKEPDSVFIGRGVHYLNNTGNSYENDIFKVPLRLVEGTWVKLQCSSVTNNNTAVQGGFNLILIRN